MNYTGETCEVYFDKHFKIARKWQNKDQIFVLFHSTQLQIVL